MQYQSCSVWPGRNLLIALVFLGVVAAALNVSVTFAAVLKLNDPPSTCSHHLEIQMDRDSNAEDWP